MPFLNISAVILRDKAYAAPAYDKTVPSYLQAVLEEDLKTIEARALIVADKQKEASMPLEDLDILEHLRYARYPEGERVLPHHALNAVTRAFFEEVVASGCWLTHFYVGPETAIFDPNGPQRLRLHWARG